VPSRTAKTRFGSTVRKFREERGYSQEKLAERAGLHRNYIGGVERGERNVALENIVKLAKALSVSPRELFADFRELDVLFFLPGDLKLASSHRPLHSDHSRAFRSLESVQQNWQVAPGQKCHKL